MEILIVCSTVNLILSIFFKNKNGELVSAATQTTGYKVAISVLELFISTERENFSTRSAQLAISSLKLELEGWKNEAGITVANGLGQKLDKAVTMATERLFPKNKTITFKQIW